MYQIDSHHNQIHRLEPRTFAELGFREREHLQEWIAKDPACLGEELLIIQKEFDGFQDTRERLDLLALDKQGQLVIIENKLDDSGRDVTWQVLKYASYCSSLSKEEIRRIYQAYLDRSPQAGQAGELIAEFLEVDDFAEVQLNVGQSQRIILVAANYRREVTSTVLWLLNFNLRIQCFKVSLNALGEQLFLHFEQILPVKDTEEYAISMAAKNQEEITQKEGLKSRHHIRLAFWAAFLEQANQAHGLFSNVSPSKENWIGAGIGMSGLGLNVVVSGTHARTEIFINKGGDQVENKRIFDFFLQRQAALESALGEPLIWERLEEKKSSRIKLQLDGVSIFERADWPRMIAYLIDTSARMERAFRPVVKELERR